MSNFLSTLGYGGTVAIIGLCIVFVGLSILILCVWLMARVFDSINAKKDAAEKAAAAKAAPAPAPVAAPAPAPVEEPVVDDAELIAVISAAIAAFDNSGKTLVVRKVRRVFAWNRSSREEQVCRF